MTNGEPYYNARWRAGSAAACLLVVLFVAFFFFERDRYGTADGQTQTKTRRAEPAGREQARGLARLEPEAGIIGVAAQHGARIRSIEVEEGQSVEPGELLAVIEGEESARRQLELARAEKEAAEFKRSLQRRQRELERERFDRLRDERLEKMRDRIKAMEDRLRVAQDNRERITALDATADRVAAQDYVINQSKAELAQAKLELTEFETDLELLADKRTLEDDELADNTPEFQLLDRKIALAEAQLEQTMIRAPAVGEILEVLAKPGEVAAGPILLMGDTRSMVAVVELFQTDVSHVNVGDAATVEIFDSSIPATVKKISRMVGSNQLTSVDPMALADRRVVKVTLQLEDSELASRYVNMQVSAIVAPGSKPRSD